MRRRDRSAAAILSGEGVSLDIKETPFQGQVLQLAKLCGWLAYHTHDSRRSEAGFPDLVLVRGGTLLYRELKRNTTYPTPAQREWISRLKEAGADVAVWRPRDWEIIVSTLKRRYPPEVSS